MGGYGSVVGGYGSEVKYGSVGSGVERNNIYTIT